MLLCVAFMAVQHAIVRVMIVIVIVIVMLVLVRVLDTVVVLVNVKMGVLGIDVVLVTHSAAFAAFARCSVAYASTSVSMR